MSKTGYCLPNAKGFCAYGTSCWYSHDPMNLPLCRYFQRGEPCPYEKCWFRHVRKAGEHAVGTQAPARKAPQKQAPAVQASVETGENAVRTQVPATKARPKQASGIQASVLGEITNKTSGLSINSVPPATNVVRPTPSTQSNEPTKKPIGKPKTTSVPVQNGGAIPKKTSTSPAGSCPGKSKTGPCGINPKKGCSNGSCKKHCKETGKKCQAHDLPAAGSTGSVIGDENADHGADAPPPRKAPKKVPKNPCPGQDGSCTTAARKGCKNKMCIKCCTSEGKFYCPPHEKTAQDKGGRGRRDEFDIQAHYIKWDRIKPSKRLQSQKDWDELLQSGTLSGMRNLSFGADFGIKDTHLETMAEQCKDLVVCSLGDEETGDGVYLTDQAVIKLAENCPKLIRLKLESCTHITDKALAVIFEKLQALESLEISGHDKCNGRITKKGANLLLQRAMAPKLRHFDFSHQFLEFEVTEKLQKCRKNLQLCDGMESQMINEFCKWANYGIPSYSGFDFGGFGDFW